MPGDKIVALSFHPDGRHLVSLAQPSGAEDQLITRLGVWDLDRPQEPPVVLAGHSGSDSHLIVSQHGQTAVTVGDGRHAPGGVWVWDLDRPQGQPVHLPGPDARVLALAVGPAGRQIAAANADAIRLWNLNRPDAVPEAITQGAREVTFLAFHPDGRRLIGARESGPPIDGEGGFGWVRVWDLSQLHGQHRSLVGKDDRLRNPLIDPTGHVLIVPFIETTSKGSHALRSLLLIDLERPDVQTAELRGHDGAITQMAFCPDGRTLLSADDAGMLRSWDLEQPESEPIAAFSRIERVLNRNS
jgi:WD40 repeat protein